MKLRINNSTDALQVLNENLEGLMTGKRKLPFVKEVNNTVGKVASIVKMDLMHKAIIGDRTPMAWFSNVKQLESKPK